MERCSLRALLWFRRAAGNGERQASRDLLQLPNWPASAPSVTAWLLESAEGGDASSQHALSLILALGACGEEQHRAKASDWCAKAASQGLQLARAMQRGLGVADVAVVETPSAWLLRL